MGNIQSNKEYEDESFVDLNLEKGIIRESNFLNCKFDSINLTEATLSGCKFEDCLFENVNLSLAKLPDTRIISSKFINSKLTGIDWTKLSTRMGLSLDLEECDLNYGIFVKLDIATSIFKKCRLKECSFEECDMKKVSFAESDLMQTQFIKCNLTESDFRGALNYLFNPSENICKKMKVSEQEGVNLLLAFGIETY